LPVIEMTITQEAEANIGSDFLKSSALERGECWLTLHDNSTHIFRCLPLRML
jgi:hypothetical protein